MGGVEFGNGSSVRCEVGVVIVVGGGEEGSGGGGPFV